MKINSHLSFNGQCREAFKFYEQSLGANIGFIMTYGESPMGQQTPAEWRDKVMHARLDIGNQTLMGADAPPDRYERPQGFAVAIHTDQPAEAERIFKQLAEGATVQMPLQETFWAQRFGMLVDRFGIPWMLNCEKHEQ